MGGLIWRRPKLYVSRPVPKIHVGSQNGVPFFLGSVKGARQKLVGNERRKERLERIHAVPARLESFSHGAQDVDGVKERIGTGGG